MEDENKTLVIADPTTGEIISELNEGDRIVRKASIDKYNSTMSFNKDEPFVKVFSNVLFELSDKLSGKESLFLYYLLQYVNFEDGILERNKEILTKEMIIEETKQSERNIERLIAGLIEKEVIGKHRTGTKKVAYTINPFIFMKGKRIDLTLYELYKKSKWAKLYEE
jgi:hypothetical protein